MKSARGKLEVSMPAAIPCKLQRVEYRETCRVDECKTEDACLVEADESMRKRMEGSPHKNHEGHIAGKGMNSMKNSQSVVPSTVSIGMDLCWESRSTTTVRSVNTFFPQILIDGLRTVPSTNFEDGQIHHTLRINLGIRHVVLNQFFIHHVVLNQFFIHHDILTNSHHDILTNSHHDILTNSSFITLFWLFFQLFSSMIF